MSQGPIKTLLNTFNLRALCSISHRGPLHDWGWFKSYRLKQSVNQSGEPIPWITYPAFEFLTGRVRTDMSVFEFGAGNGTLWWASRVSRVTGVEHDADWYARMKTLVPENVDLHHVPLEYDGNYCRKVLEFPHTFDLVIVDGRDRARCALNAPAALKPDGVILFDNTNRPHYQDALKSLAESGFRRIRFVGLAPIENTTSETSILYRTENCLGI